MVELKYRASTDFGKRKRQIKLELSSIAKPHEEIVSFFFREQFMRGATIEREHMSLAQCDSKIVCTTAGLLPFCPMLDY